MRRKKITEELDPKIDYMFMSIHDKDNIRLKESMRESCVAFLDILGFKEMIKNDIDRVIFLSRFLKAFKNFYFRSPTNFEINKSSLPKATMFSDSIILSAEIDKYFDFYNFAYAIAELQATLLKENIVLRGGIEVGSLYHNAPFVFGEGLLNAYYLESKIAKYPRIVIGNGVLRELEKRENERYDDYYFVHGTYRGLDFDSDIQRIISTEKNEDAFDEKLLAKLDDDTRKLIEAYKSVSYIDYLRYAFKKYEPLNISRQREYSDEIDLYYDELEPMIKFIKNGLLNDSQCVKQKYEWLKKAFNGALEMFIGRLKDKADQDYINFWIDKVIE